jgi:hypothetical protein
MPMPMMILQNTNSPVMSSAIDWAESACARVVVMMMMSSKPYCHCMSELLLHQDE